jgi:outer membrane protein assembly factor BamB
VKWIALAGGLLAVLAGDADVIQPITYQTVSGNPNGRELAVYDPATNSQLWHETLGGDVDERMIVVRDERIYALVPGVGVECRELRTGTVVWTNPDRDIQTEFRVPDSKALGQYLFSQPALMAVDDALILRAVWAKNMAVLSRTDGKLLWRRATGGGGRALTSLAVNGLWLGGGGAVDLRTGQSAPGPRFVSSGCGPTTAMPGYLVTCFGTVCDMKSGLVVRPDDIKSPCDVGSLVSEGIMVTVPSECGCNYEVKGYRALASAGAIRPHAAAESKDRLTVLDAPEPAALAVTDGDWPTYRRDSQRSGASAATVAPPSAATQPMVLWHWKPAGAGGGAVPAGSGPRLTADYLATAPVAAAGYVWFASHDGLVRCLKADSGQEVWRFATAGYVFAPPTIVGGNHGRVLVGGGDGRVYCLDATTGRRLWQFLAGPVDRRVFWFGHLVSTWPMLSGVTVQDGVAYAVAGYQAENGIHAYAMDPRSGKTLWEKHDAGLPALPTPPSPGGPGGPGFAYSSGGHVAVGAGRLWLCSSTASPGSFELQSGEFKPLARGGGQFGSEISMLAGNWVIHGGRRLSETQDTIGRPLGGAGFVAYSAQPQVGKVPLIDQGTALPAWDAELTVMPPRGVGGNLTAVPTAKLLDWLAGRIAPAGPPPAPRTQPAGPPAPRPAPADWSQFKLWTTEGPGMTPIAFALARDQVVVAYGAMGGAYKLGGFRRTDGTRAWTVDLPSQPAMGRLAIDRDGRVLLSLCDGSVMCVGR